jgi:hypothetical protein
MKLQTGTILNCAYNEGLFMKLVSLGNRIHYGKSAKWTHSAIVVSELDADNKVWVAEALGKGFTISEYESWWIYNQVKLGRIAIGYPKKKIDKKLVYDLAKKYEGIGYGWTDIFDIVLHILFGKKSFIIDSNAKKLICSEAVCRILYDASDKKLDFEKEFGIDYDLIMPQDIYNSESILWEGKDG